MAKIEPQRHRDKNSKTFSVPPCLCGVYFLGFLNMRPHNLTMCQSAVQSIFVEVRPDALLNLAKLILHKGMEDEVADEGLLMPTEELLEADGLRLATPIHWNLTVRSTGSDEYLLEGHTTTTALVECRRCLTEVNSDLATEFYYQMVYKPGPAELKLLETNDENDETLIFGKPQVDFANLITQLMAIELPLTVLCKEDCKGLSPDGVNLNEHPEAAPKIEEPVSESPFAGLKDIKL